MAFNKAERRKRIHLRVRKQIRGSAERPRLSVYRSNKEIYCQLIDDLSGKTLAAASSTEFKDSRGGNKTEQAKKVGEMIAERATEHNVNTIVFDRGGYLYHGRVRALAEGAREKGLKF